MLFWWEKIKIREKILMICFIFYLNCLNDKEKQLKLLIYKKYNFLYAWESKYLSVLKKIHIPTERDLKGESKFSWHLIPSMIYKETQESLNIPKNPKTLPRIKHPIRLDQNRIFILYKKKYVNCSQLEAVGLMTNSIRLN